MTENRTIRGGSSQIDRFMFDLWLDGTPMPTASQPAGQTQDDTELEEEAFSEAELDAAKAAGYAEGLEAGEAKALNSFERQATLTLAAIESHLGTLVGAATTAQAEIRGDIIVVATAIARKMIGSAFNHDEVEAIETFAGECIQRLYGEDQLVIKVSDGLAEKLGSRLQQVAQKVGFAGAVDVLDDPSLGSADCKIEWQNGHAERNAESLKQDIDETISAIMADLNQVPTPPATDSDTHQAQDEITSTNQTESSENGENDV